jgi:hypothetical protein
MDYKSWVSRSIAFLEGIRALPGEPYLTIEIAPPLTSAELGRIQSNWHRHLPAELVRFWLEGSANLSGRYGWRPPAEELPSLREVFEYSHSVYGGPRFIAASKVNPNPRDTSYFGGDIMTGDAEECQRTIDLWGRSIIIMHVDNGDCLGLDPEAPGCDPDDPPVVYLVHDDSSSDQICPRFTTFLSIWEELSYVGPENWLLNKWLDKNSKTLSTNLHHTSELRRLLTPR